MTARDALDKLEKLDKTNPDVSSAISQCEQRVGQLEADENKMFDQANQALMNGDCQQAAKIYRSLASSDTKYKKEAQEKYSATSDCSQKGTSPIRGGSCDPGSLTMVDALFRAKKYLEARNKAQALVVNCTDQATRAPAEEWIRKIGRREKSNQLRDDVVVKINNRMFDQACEKIREIQSTESDYPDLPDLLRRAEGCTRNDLLNTRQAEAKKLLTENKLKEAQAKVNEIRSANSGYGGLKELQSEIDGRLEAEYQKVIRLMEQRNWAKASAALHGILEVNPGYKDAATLLSKSQAEARKDAQKTSDERLAELVLDAKKYSEQGDYLTAREKCKEASAIRQTRAIDQLEQDISQAMNAEATLSTAIDAYYSGNYEKAQLGLEAFVKDSRWPRLRAFGRFYLGATILSQYFLSGGTEEKKKIEAMEVFRQQLKEYSSFQPPWDLISPKVKAAYAQAAGIKP